MALRYPQEEAPRYGGRDLPPIPGLSVRDGFRFRRGQHLFLLKLADAFRANACHQLGVFVPGYGKTITALASFVVAHHLGLARKLVVFVPRGNLRDQYADAQALSRLFHQLGAPPFSFCVADSERVFLKNLDTSIIITTYQYASGRGGHRALLEYTHADPCMFVFDEVHHLSEDGLWASKIEQFPSSCSVALSGTPMRSDNKTLFGVPFEVDENGEQYYVALHEVTVRDAHEEGRIIKQVEAHVIDYRLKMVRGDTGQEVEMTLSEMAALAGKKKDIDTFLARRKLRFHEVYLETLLQPAFARFAEKRSALQREVVASGRAARGPFRNHQMLIIAMSNRHAAAILSFVQTRFPSYTAARIGQDVPAAERTRLLDEYREGLIDVMVQVDMIGEGTDIKPISIIVKADLVRALSKTMQQVFRGMRYFDDFSEEGNVCDVYAADDSEIVRTLRMITSEQQIGIRLREQFERDPANAPSEPTEHSVWELKSVQNQAMQTHRLDLFHQAPPPPPPEPPVHAVDVSEQERVLRKSCAALASELAFALRAEGNPVDVRTIHARAKQKFAKGQGDLSLSELERKRKWLERCIRSRRMV